MRISKKIVALLMASMISIGIVGCSSEDSTEDVTQNDTTKQEQQAKQKEDKEETVDATNLTIEEKQWVSNLLGVERIQDYEGNQALKLSYDFLNKSEDPQSPFMNVSFKAFQNGVELESVFMSDDVDLGLGQKEILGGAKIDKAETGFILSDESDVILHVEEFISFDNDTSEFTINLDTLEITRTK